MTDFSNLLNSLFTLLQNWTTAILAYLFNIIVDFVQVLFDYIVQFALWVVGLFPSGAAIPVYSDATPTGSTFSAFVNVLNWFFPIGYFVSLLTVFAAACVAYFVIAPLARWVKLLT